MSDKLKLRVWGAFAPEGSPEREYWEANLAAPFGQSAVETPRLKAAAKRLAEEGCPVFEMGQKAVWAGVEWKIENDFEGVGK